MKAILWALGCCVVLFITMLGMVVYVFTPQSQIVVGIETKKGNNNRVYIPVTLAKRKVRRQRFLVCPRCGEMRTNCISPCSRCGHGVVSAESVFHFRNN